MFRYCPECRARASNPHVNIGLLRLVDAASANTTGMLTQVYISYPPATALCSSALRLIGEAETTPKVTVLLSLPDLHRRRTPQAYIKNCDPSHK